MLNRFIWLVDGTLIGITNVNLSELEINSNERLMTFSPNTLEHHLMTFPLPSQVGL